jgi:hypothetical protein
MSAISLQELEKLQKNALFSTRLSNEMKSQIIDAKVRELASEIKRNISKPNAVIEVLVLTSSV